ncbi:MAG: hypothetical protein EOO77_35175 [Oxalobacteraceae bacterium]|nr:MAG: hypothetical protein EOO77_35175 [Oxalobacteraceae bacterium]
MADWFQEPTELTDRKGRRFTYPYCFTPQQHVFDGDTYYSTLATALSWCREQFGYQSEAFRCNGFQITFRKEADALAFKLRWC